ncbi:hypothetical protein BOX37_19370 [Nocardia mangyaensis]|uniref:Uncharacterized protein n=1 Tax=Nocardia mangyaensis TaxID=2213200 RepID=A0A1J0VUM6_9NOCA|nr:hypothetical protein BOX37_19370 [Nocardia mangyaensis]
MITAAASAVLTQSRARHGTHRSYLPLPSPRGTHCARSLHSGPSFRQLASVTFDADGTQRNPHVGCAEAQPLCAAADPPTTIADAATDNTTNPIRPNTSPPLP